MDWNAVGQVGSLLVGISGIGAMIVGFRQLAHAKREHEQAASALNGTPEKVDAIAFELASALNTLSTVLVSRSSSTSRSSEHNWQMELAIEKLSGAYDRIVAMKPAVHKSRR